MSTPQACLCVHLLHSLSLKLPCKEDWASQKVGTDDWMQNQLHLRISHSETTLDDAYVHELYTSRCEPLLPLLPPYHGKIPLWLPCKQS